MKKILHNIAFWILRNSGYDLPVIRKTREFRIQGEDDTLFRIELQKLVNHAKPYVQVDATDLPDGSKRVRMTLKIGEPDRITNVLLKAARKLEEQYKK